MTRRLAEMSWPAVERELEDGNTLIVVMTASIEQHGLGLPLNVDTIRADELGDRIADELGCFVAPTIRPGCSDLHRSFPGTISLQPEHFKGIVEDYCRSFDEHGFEDIVILTTHGGNTRPIQAVATTLDDELAASIHVPGSREGFLQVRTEAMAAHDVPAGAAKRHAGAGETSFILETNPELVDRENLVVGNTTDPNTSDVDRMETISENGVLGDQTQANADAGRTLIDASVQYYVGEILDALSHDTS